MRTSTFLIVGILLSLPARAQTSGDAPAALPVAMNEESGCGQGKVVEVAPTFCEDFDVGKMSSRDKDVAAAKTKCVAFYSDALRAQNVFCSYQWDAVRFKVTAKTTAEAAAVGEANVSEAAVSKDNRSAATISRAYIIRLNSLAITMKQRYQDYVVALDRLNAAGAADETFEANCNAASLRSEVPGSLRTMLSAFTAANAQISYQSMYGALRANMQKLRAMKDEAEHNAKLAEVRALEVGTVLQQEVTKDKPKDDTIPLPPSSSSINPAVQYFSTKILQSVGGKISAGAGIIGAGAMVVYQYSTGQAVKLSDTAAMFVGILQPETGLAIGLLNAAHQRQLQVLEIYRKFVADELTASHGGNVGVKNTELMTTWGQRTKQPACVSNAAQEAKCAQQRDANGGVQPYDHGPCTGSGSSTITGPTN